MNGSHLSHLDTNPGILLNVSQEMPLVVSGMQVEQITSLIDINQRDYIRPTVDIHRTYMRNLMCPEELSDFLVGHHPLCAIHATPQIARPSVYLRPGLLKLAMFLTQSGESSATQTLF
jgi:hypothetical protein